MTLRKQQKMDLQRKGRRGKLDGNDLGHECSLAPITLEGFGPTAVALKGVSPTAVILKGVSPEESQLILHRESA